MHLKQILLVVFFNLLFVQTNAQLVINEGSNKNYPTILDEDGDYEDWIEIYNAGPTAIDLFNYSLSDNSIPGEWSFPHQIIQPSEYIIVFCSGKDRFASSPFTNVLTDSTFTPQTGWNTHHFTTPFYWDGVSNIVLNLCTYNPFYQCNSIHSQSSTIYNSATIALNYPGSACGFSGGSNAQQRPNIRFNSINVGSGTLQNGYYDYPSAYSNWYEGARQQYLYTASELISAGLSAGNIDSLAFDVIATCPTNFQLFELSLANTGINSLQTNFIPPSGVRNHTNFKISSNGETIKLYNPSNVLVSSLNVNCGQGVGVSIGSFPDSAPNIQKFGTSTPGATNNFSTPFTNYAIAPLFSIGGGVYTSGFSVSITDPNSPSANVFYTLDGTDPDTTSSLWNGTAIPISQTTVLRARAFINGYLPSTTSTASYLFNLNHITPIISVITDTSNLYGPNGMFDNPSLDLLKPAYVEYFDSTANHNLIHSGGAGIMMDGGWSARSRPQRAFRINFDHGVLGDGPIMHNVIPDRPNRFEYGDFYLRNGSNNYLTLPYKDAASCKMMADGSNNYYSAWRPASVYINGNYWGLYEVREKTNSEMFELSENADPDAIEILTSSSQYGFNLRAIEGSVQSFYDSYDSLLQLNPTDTNYWNQADQYFDMKYYNDYIIAEMWIDNVDWAFNYNNLKLYRSDATNYRWRYILNDLEYGLQPNDQPWIVNCNHNFLSQLFQADPNNPHLNIWLRGIQNDRFRNYFINRFADQMNTLYLPSRLLSIDISMYNQTVVEMANEYYRWGDSLNVAGQMNDFNQYHLLYQSELSCRSEQVRNHIQSEFNLPQQVDVSLDVFPANAGKINISTITPNSYPWSGIYFDGVPIKIEAEAMPGYQFSHWEANGLISDTLNAVFLDTLQTNSISFKAYFISTLGINELTSQSILVYPNPTSEKIIIKHVNSSEILDKLNIVDAMGRKYNIPFSASGNGEYVVDVSSFTSGYYIINFTSKNGRMFNAPFIKQ